VKRSARATDVATESKRPGARPWDTVDTIARGGGYQIHDPTVLTKDAHRDRHDLVEPGCWGVASLAARALPSNAIQLVVKSHDADVTEVLFKKLPVFQVRPFLECEDLFED